jgi:hypothetical protein
LQLFILAAGDVGGDKGPTGLRVVDDPLGLTGMQLGIDGHHNQASPPSTKHELQIAWMVVHEQGHTVTWLEASPFKLMREVGAALGPLRIAGNRQGTMKHGGPVWELTRHTLQ